jgi:antitoxin ParD1/3/4
LRLLESEERKLNELRNSLIIGEQSGWIHDFNPEEHLKSLQDKYQ